ncbi:tetratricopeptide repeat protein [Ferruginibacter lapsinanis]|uniref:tetratricopeptide repeat protein n=1 Tax=Ferruginibacter lapsinanis TaxID=563172 RepID=UPI001E57868E|nr:tetratricopeptide repeat protein [Ferruginibacter lapsinanis]UEG49405.1 tetratricopeptide repeat protein [Ferruginibacter lapsinanis]
MADNQETVTTVESNEVVAKAKDFWSRFSKPIIYVGGAVILLIGGWLGYKNFIVAPKEAKSADAIFPAEQLFDKMVQNGFNKDTINVVLNGGNGINGVLKIASSFSGTNAANRAEFIAGACYLHSQDFNNAIKHLKEFSTNATQVQAAAYSMLGDASAELKKNDDALGYYSKAASLNSKDEYTTSESLFKAGLFAESIGKTKEAIEFFQKLKAEYPKSSHAGDMDKYLARLGVTN